MASHDGDDEIYFGSYTPHVAGVSEVEALLSSGRETMNMSQQKDPQALGFASGAS